MNLNQLLEKGGYVEAGYAEKTISWTNDEGEEFEFVVQIKTEMTAKDHEVIYLGLDANRRRSDAQDDSVLARRVHRMVKIYNEETKEFEPVPLHVANRMKTSLLFAICTAFEGAEVPPESEEEAEKN